MPIQLDEATRNARLDVIESLNGTSCCLEIRTGVQPPSCAAPSSGTVLATINLPTDWMSPASGGVKSKLGVWQDTTADATGLAGHFRIYSSQATKDGTTCFMQGSVGQGAGNLSLDNISIVAGQTINIGSFDLTSGNA